MSLDFSDAPGWPAEAPPVAKDPVRLFPELLFQVSRQKGLDRHTKYRHRKRLARELAK